MVFYCINEYDATERTFGKADLDHQFAPQRSRSSTACHLALCAATPGPRNEVTAADQTARPADLSTRTCS